jgi:uncharacterized protein (TIRG00374 family)
VSATEPGRRRWWRALRVLLGLALSAVALWAVLRRVSWPELERAVSGADGRFLLVAALLYPWRLVVISWRWGELLSLYGPPPPFRERLRATSLGYLLNNLLPLRSGDFLRGGLAVRSGAPVQAAVSSLVLEKVLDLWALVALALICGSAFLSRERVLGESLRALALVAGVSLVGFVILALSGRAQALRAWCERKSFRGAGVASRIAQVLAESCDLCRRPRRLGWTALATAINWGLEGSFYWLVAHALGLPLTLPGALFMVAVIALGLTVPTTAGGLGVAQFLAVMVLRAQGADLGAATAYSLVSWMLGYLCLNAVGLGFLLAGAGRQGRREMAHE